MSSAGALALRTETGLRDRSTRRPRPRRFLATTSVAMLLLFLAGSAGAATIGYWRMEVDDDPSAAGL